MLDASGPNSVSMKMEAKPSFKRSEKHTTTLHDRYKKAEDHDLRISHHKKLINNNVMLLTHL
jgi:hypothetical protein